LKMGKTEPEKLSKAAEVRTRKKVERQAINSNRSPGLVNNHGGALSTTLIYRQWGKGGEQTPRQGTRVGWLKRKRPTFVRGKGGWRSLCTKGQKWRKKGGGKQQIPDSHLNRSSRNSFVEHCERKKRKVAGLSPLCDGGSEFGSGP